jgi:hypothetical protein
VGAIDESNGDWMTDDLERLRAENSRLRQQLSLAGVTQLPPADMPDAGELVALHSMVVHTYPQLACSQSEFEKGLLFCAHARRSEKLNAAYFGWTWADAASDWLRRQGYQSSISLAAFTAACIASGVPYSPIHDNYPRNLEFGLQIGGVAKPSSLWRDVLNHGIPRPTPLARQVNIEEPIEMARRTDVESGPRASDVQVRR